VNIFEEIFSNIGNNEDDEDNKINGKE